MGNQTETDNITYSLTLLIDNELYLVNNGLYTNPKMQP